MSELSTIKSIQIINLSDNFEDWFNDWVSRNKMTVTYNGSYAIAGKAIRFDIIRARLFLESRRASRKFTYQDIDANLTLHHDGVRQAYLKEKIESLAKTYKPNNSLKEFVIALTGKEDLADLNVIQHFIWQVKRKLLDLVVEHHMMPVVCGDSGSGKSIAIRKLLEPLGDLVAEKQLDCFRDERHYIVFEEFRAVFLDEMAKAEHTDFESMKNIITSSRITWKPLYTNKQINIQNNATVIGTSNYSISDMIKDSTSSRRWYQINTPTHCNWEKINALDYQALWQSVDAYGPCPLTESFEEIRSRQESIRYKTDVEIFASECELTPSKEGRTKTQDLYDHFKQWCECNGLKPWSKVHFARQLVRLKFELTRMGPKSRRERGFYCMAPGIPFEPTDYSPP